MRIGGIIAAIGIAVVGGRAATPPTLHVTELPSPASPAASAPALTLGPAGDTWLSWVEPASTGAEARNALRFTTLPRGTDRWSDARTIAAGATVANEAADAPQLAIAGNKRVYAVWSNGNGGAAVSTSDDRGHTWTAPKAWAPSSAKVEKFSFAPLPDGRVLAVWLDGRNRRRNGNRQQLFSRVMDVRGEDPDTLVDPSACDCCPTSVVSFIDGSAIVAYRGRADDETRDIRVAQGDGVRWGKPRVPVPDNWRIDACPVNGPRLATDGSRLAVAWFTGADNDPRVEVSYSPDAGRRWLMPLRVDRGHPIGHPDAVLLHDSAILVTWLERDGSVWLQRITPEFATTNPLMIAGPGAAAASTFPRLALRRDYTGGRSSAEIVVAYGAKAGGVRTQLVTVPEGDLLAAERNCDCAPKPEELEGFPLQGTAIAIDPATNTVRLRHAEVPGVFSAGEHAFKVAPLSLGALHPGLDILGRIDRHDGSWWLDDVRALGQAQP